MVMYHLICGSRLLVDFTGINTALILFHCNKAMRSVFWASPTCEAGGCCQDIPYAHLPRQIRILPFLVAWSLSSRTGTTAFFEKKSRCLSYLWWYSFSLFIEPSTAARESYISHRTNAAIFSLLLAIVLAKRCKNHGEEQVQDAATVAQVQRSLQCLRWPSPLPVARNKSQNESLWTVMRKSILIIYTVYILWYQYCWSFFIAFQALTLFCTIMFDSWSHNPTSGLSSAKCSLSAQQILQQFETLECLKVPVLVISWWAKLIRKYCTRLIKIARSSVCLKDQLDCLICWIFAAVCTVATFRKSGSKLLCVTCNAKAAAQGSHTDSWGLPAKARTSSSQSPTSFAAQLQMLQRILFNIIYLSI